MGIQDCYPFWRDWNHAPWAGKPVWARAACAGGSRGRHDHHHILLDDNIHNDSNDGAGGIRVPVVGVDDGRDATVVVAESTSYTSLRGDEALRMHGNHLIRAPKVRPLLEDNWFVRRIEKARREILAQDTRKEKVIELNRRKCYVPFLLSCRGRR